MVRVGKQQIVWGKTDFFRLLDIINPLDYSWHFFFESFDDIRIPQTMVKAQLSLGTIGNIKDMSVEFVVNPRDFNSTDLGRFGQPWALAPKGFELIPQFKPDDGNMGVDSRRESGSLVSQLMITIPISKILFLIFKRVAWFFRE